MEQKRPLNSLLLPGYVPPFIRVLPLKCTKKKKQIKPFKSNGSTKRIFDRKYPPGEPGDLQRIFQFEQKVLARITFPPRNIFCTFCHYRTDTGHYVRSAGLHAPRVQYGVAPGCLRRAVQPRALSSIFSFGEYF